jgi:hypothetical protein
LDLHIFSQKQPGHWGRGCLHFHLLSISIRKARRKDTHFSAFFAPTCRKNTFFDEKPHIFSPPMSLFPPFLRYIGENGCFPIAGNRTKKVFISSFNKKYYGRCFSSYFGPSDHILYASASLLGVLS